jgi:predicted NBD/HSP70 family sugar kinase
MPNVPRVKAAASPPAVDRSRAEPGEPKRVRVHSPQLILGHHQRASNRTPRQLNRDLIFNQIRIDQPISRADLARHSGLQRSTISYIVEELLAEDWVVEGCVGQTSRGRRPTYLMVNRNKAVVAVDIHPTKMTVAVADLSGNISTERQVDLPADPSKVIAAIVKNIHKMMTDHSEYSFQGIGLTLPGRFSHELEKAVFAPNVAWPIAQIKSRVEAATGLPVAVDNVANACALSEVWFGYCSSNQDLVVVNVSEGIGTGIYANGRLLRGNSEGAGEFGHIQIDKQGLRCGCGSHGCWETIASNRAALRYYNEGSKNQATLFERLLELAEGGDPRALSALKKMCTALGRGLHMIICALSPDEIVVVGELTRLWQIALPLIEEGLRGFPVIRVPKIRVPKEPARARLRGAVALIINERCWMLHAGDEASAAS